jgi:hypothetical protein
LHVLMVYRGVMPMSGPGGLDAYRLGLWTPAIRPVLALRLKSAIRPTATSPVGYQAFDLRAAEARSVLERGRLALLELRRAQPAGRLSRGSARLW